LTAINKRILNIDYREFTLNNGLKVVLSKNTRIPVVAINSTFHIGSKDEDVDKTGMAHLFEHLMFEGSENIGKRKFDEILNSNGGDSNAYTSWDVTSYHIIIPSGKLELALWLDSDRLSSFGIDKDSLEIQKNVVMEEKLQVHDNTPFGSLEEESSKRLFTNSGYEWPIIGNTKHLAKLTLDDINDFFNKFYIPSNMVLSIVGDIDYAESESLVKKYYEDIPTGKEIKRNLYVDKEIDTEINEIIYDDIHLAGKFFFYKIPKYGTREYYIAKVLSGILTEGDSSRLFNTLIYEKQLLNEVDSAVYGMEHAGLLVINSIVLKDIEHSYVENEIDKIIDDIKNGKITEMELSKIKNRLITEYFTKLQTNSNLADKLSELRTFYPDCSKINDEINEYKDISIADITNFIVKYLDKNKRLILNYLPKEKTK
jgi:zinc protease